MRCAITDTMLERVLLNLDVGLPGAILRVALGASLAVVLHLLLPSAGLAASAGWLAAMLFGLKAFTAVARKVLPTTPAVRATWEWRRNLARYYDSYQWRKLVWFGVGILAATGVSRQQWWGMRLGAGCLLSGALAELAWRQKRLTTALPGGR